MTIVRLFRLPLRPPRLPAPKTGNPAPGNEGPYAARSNARGPYGIDEIVKYTLHRRTACEEWLAAKTG